MGEWRSERRHDPVTHHVVHRPLVAMHSFHHPLDYRIEQSSGFLRVAVCQEFHRALEVSEQHGDLLAFAFQGAFGRQDLLGKMLRSVRVRRLRRWGFGYLWSITLPQPLAAFPAEIVAECILGAALRTTDHQLRPTLGTEG